MASGEFVGASCNTSRECVGAHCNTSRRNSGEFVGDHCNHSRSNSPMIPLTIGNKRVRDKYLEYLIMLQAYTHKQINFVFLRFGHLNRIQDTFLFGLILFCN